jgi:hypothetical protein
MHLNNIYAHATSTTFSIHAYTHFQQNLLYCPAYHGLNIYCPAPRIAGYQSPLPFLCAMDYRGEIKLPDYKLVTVCEYFKISLFDAHNALSDARSIRDIWLRINGVSK